MNRENTLKELSSVVSSFDAMRLRHISVQLHRWHELECGVENGGIERDEKTGKCIWYNSRTGTRTPHRDMETAALKRLAKIMQAYPLLRAYVQGDPRGCALYILRPEDAPLGQEDSHYNNGIAVWILSDY